ncbi:hypothetical protein A1OW_21610 [Enterovibrio norvegicus]|nr:hypothetical protein A1OW_21610 [Enterovibrio norvegicus]
MLAAMPLSTYWGWVDYLRRHGLPSRNTERLLQQLNAGVLNASGRYQNVAPSDFMIGPRKDAPTDEGVSQSVLNQMLGDMSSLSFDHPPPYNEADSTRGPNEPNND